MNNQPFNSNLTAQSPAATLSVDGYVRLTLDTLSATPLVHLISGLDEDARSNVHEGASSIAISGYTEWISTSKPTVTIGWDWRLDVSQGKLLYIRLDHPRSNIMLIDPRQNDFGHARTMTLLQSVIDSLAWQAAVDSYVAIRYA